MYQCPIQRHQLLYSLKANGILGEVLYIQLPVINIQYAAHLVLVVEVDKNEYLPTNEKK